MEKIKVDYAIRLATQNLDEWVDVTGIVPMFSGYHGEMQGIVEDAVRIGILVALEHKVEIKDGEVIDNGLIGSEE